MMRKEGEGSARVKMRLDPKDGKVGLTEDVVSLGCLEGDTGLVECRPHDGVVYKQRHAKINQVLISIRDSIDRAHMKERFTLRVELEDDDICVAREKMTVSAQVKLKLFVRGRCRHDAPPMSAASSGGS
jgi:hypothetical protein